VVVKHSKRKHSLFGPSSADRWMACPGSVELSKSAPPSRDSVYAREGTEAHECLEFIVLRYNDLNQASREAYRRWPKVMVDHCIAAAHTIHSDKLRPSREAVLYTEQRVELKSERKIYGTLDYAWVDLFETLVVIDFKYGAGVTVFAEDEDGEPNPQLMIYAAALASKHNYDFEKVKIAIIQPRVWAADEDPVTFAEYSVPKLREFERKVKEAVKLASSDNAYLFSGEHCRWCPSLATCPENSKKALQQAHIDFDIEEGIQSAPEVMLLDADTIGNVLNACDKLEVWIKAVRERAHVLAEQGTKIKGYKLVAKKAQRSWREGAELKAAEKWGLYAYKLEKHFLSPAQLEKALGKETQDFVRENTVSISSGSNLVPEDDKRSELVSTSVFDFEDDEDLDEFSW